MFSLDDTFRYWLYNRPVDMRKSFNGLSGIVTNAMAEKLRSGDVCAKLSKLTPCNYQADPLFLRY